MIQWSKCRSFLLVMCLLGATLSEAAPKRVVVPVRGKENKNSPVLLFHGGRPWTAGNTASCLAKCGARVSCVSSEYLAGEGGASIKAFATDKVEPQAKDGITPSFQKLDKFKAVFFASIPTQNLANILTPERIEQLKTYVENGGVVVFDNAAPSSVQELLPVDLAQTAGISGDEAALLAGIRPEDPRFAFLPEKFSIFGGTYCAQPTADAKVISYIGTKDGSDKLGALIAEKTIGKGKVVYLAFPWKRQAGLRQIWSWAYGQRLIVSTIAYAADLKLDQEKLVDYSPVPPPQPKDEVTLDLADPQMLLQDCAGAAVITETGAELPGGVKLAIDAEGKVAVTYPGQEVPTLTYTAIPTMRFFAAMEKLTSDTSEAVDTRIKYKKVEAAPWTYAGAKAEGNTVVLSFTSEKGEFDWQFKAGTLDLDGRHYDAVADRVIVKKYDGLLQTISLKYNLKLGKKLAGHRAKRLACYAGPRGWADMDFSGKRAASTSSYGWFGAGQPFSWLVSPEAIFSSFAEAPILTDSTQSVNGGGSFVQETVNVTVGRRKAPIETKYIWHSFSVGAERGHNDWMAMYQFQRKHHRAATGLKEIPSVPTASHANTLSAEQSAKAIETAGKLGFQQFHLQRCPSSIQSLASDSLGEKFAQIRAHGMLPRPWTPADYSHGDGEEVFEHQDYFIRNADGKIFSYFGKHPVLNMGNPDVVKWYTGIVDQAVKNGLGAIYTDMGGALTGNIDFAGEESGTGLEAIIPIYQYYHKNNIQFGIEGQTPLGLNSFWYRRQVYNPFYGNEFSLIGSLCYSNEVDDIDLDYFRLAMYDSFMLTHVEGYAMDFERRPQEIERIARAGKLNPQINEALKVTGMPFIRETACGTSWVGKDGAAIFCYDPVKKLTVNYNGKTETFTDVPGDSILIIRK